MMNKGDITINEYNELCSSLTDDKILIKDNSIYFISKVNFGAGIIFDELCKIEIKKKKKYYLNKTKTENSITDSVDIFNEYLEKKRAGVRGYKGKKMGFIENYYYLSNYVEFATKAGDAEGFYWWTDREHKVKISSNIGTQIRQYVDSLSSQFIKCA